MKKQASEKQARRTLLQRLFGAGLGNNIIMIWVEEKGRYAFGQVETETKLKLGRHTILRWTRFYTPHISDAAGRRAIRNQFQTSDL